VHHRHIHRPRAGRCESGFPVFVWTVNDPADMCYLIRVGVDASITDRPDLLLSVLEDRDLPAVEKGTGSEPRPRS